MKKFFFIGDDCKEVDTLEYTNPQEMRGRVIYTYPNGAVVAINDTGNEYVIQDGRQEIPISYSQATVFFLALKIMHEEGGCGLVSGFLTKAAERVEI